MGKLKMYHTSIPREHIIREREVTYLSLSPKEKFLQLVSLIHLSVALNGDEPIKRPQGKGLVISKKKAPDMSLDMAGEEMLLLLKTFEQLQVRYLIVGGFAVNRYGYKRTTGDLDIYLKDTPENRSKLIEPLDRMNYGRFDMLMDVPIIAGY